MPNTIRSYNHIFRNNDGFEHKNDNDKNKKSPIRLDSINIRIIRELVKNANAKSPEIAKKTKIPLSTVQRRKARLEESILKKRYDVDLTEFGWRTADLLIGVGNGLGLNIAKELLDKCKNNVKSVSLRIGNPEINIMAQVIYKTSEEFYKILEEIKAIPYLVRVESSEIAQVVGNNDAALVNTALV
jgi:DNA-binding Lrp family transcriptional regulator